MRRLSEVEFDIDELQRVMSGILIKQSYEDEQLRIYDRRLQLLVHEKYAILAKGL